MQMDSKTAWLWIVSFLGICAFPTSILFISEFIIIREMIIKHHYILAILFVLLLTIILFGIGKVVLKMSFGKLSEDKEKLAKENIKKLGLGSYFPQTIMLIFLFVLGIYIPSWLYIYLSAFVKTLM